MSLYIPTSSLNNKGQTDFQYFRNSILICIFCLDYLVLLLTQVSISRLPCPSWLSCSSCPVLLVSRPLASLSLLTPSWLSCPGCPVLAVLSWLFCLGCPYLAVCPNCPLLAILSKLSSPGCSVLHALLWLSCSGFHDLAVLY